MALIEIGATMLRVNDTSLHSMAETRRGLCGEHTWAGAGALKADLLTLSTPAPSPSGEGQEPCS